MLYDLSNIPEFSIHPSWIPELVEQGVLPEHAMRAYREWAKSL